MSRYVWTPLNHPPSPQMQNFYPYQQIQLPSVDSIDWDFIDSIDVLRLNTTLDKIILKRLQTTFLDATSFNTNNPLHISKLFQLLQILVDYQRNLILRLKETNIKLVKNNATLKHEIKKTSKIKCQKCPICLKDVHTLSNLDTHIFKRHSSISYVWQQIRAPHKDSEEAFEALTKTLAIQSPSQQNSKNDESFNNTLRKINKQMKGFQKKFDDVENKIQDLKSTMTIDQLIATKVMSTQEIQQSNHKHRKKSSHRSNKPHKSTHHSLSNKRDISPSQRQKIQNSDPLDEVVTIRKTNPFTSASFQEQSDLQVLSKPAKTTNSTTQKPQSKLVNDQVPQQNTKKENEQEKISKTREIKLDDQFLLSDSSSDKVSNNSNQKPKDENNTPPAITVNKPKEQKQEKKDDQNTTKLNSPPKKEEKKSEPQKNIKKDISADFDDEFELPSPTLDEPKEEPKKSFTSPKKEDPKKSFTSPKKEEPKKDLYDYSDNDNIDFEEFHNTPAQVLRHSSSLLDIKPPLDPPKSKLSEKSHPGDEFIFRSDDDSHGNYAKQPQQNDYDDFVYEEDENGDYYNDNDIVPPAANGYQHYNSDNQQEYDEFDDYDNYGPDDHYDNNSGRNNQFPAGISVDDNFADSDGYEGRVTTTKSQQPKYAYYNDYNDYEEEEDYYYNEPPVPVKPQIYQTQQQVTQSPQNKKNLSLSPNNLANYGSMSMATVSGDSQEYYQDDDNNIKTINLAEDYIPPPSSFNTSKNRGAKVERMISSEEFSPTTPNSPGPRINTSSWQPKPQQYITPPHSDENLGDTDDDQFNSDSFPDDFGDVPQLPDFPDSPVQNKKRLLA